MIGKTTVNPNEVGPDLPVNQGTSRIKARATVSFEFTLERLA